MQLIKTKKIAEKNLTQKKNSFSLTRENFFIHDEKLFIDNRILSSRFASTTCVRHVHKRERILYEPLRKVSNLENRKWKLVIQ